MKESGKSPAAEEDPLGALSSPSLRLPSEPAGIPQISETGLAVQQVYEPRGSESRAFQPGASSGLPGAEEEQGTRDGLDFSPDYDAQIPGGLASY